MAVTLTNETKPGDLYVDEHGHVHRILHYCTQPTVTMEQMATGSQTGGAVGCLNLDKFTPVASLNESQLLEAVEWLSIEVRQGLQDRIALREQIVSLKEQIFKLKYPEE